MCSYYKTNNILSPFVLFSVMPDPDLAIQCMPPIYGLPCHGTKWRPVVPKNFQIAFSVIDNMVYNDLIEPFLPLFRELLFNYTSDFRGPFGNSWAAERFEVPSSRFLEGNELASEHSVFHRSGLRIGESPGLLDPSWIFRIRKTVTNMWLVARHRGEVAVCRSYHIKIAASRLRVLITPPPVPAKHPFVFYGEVEGEDEVRCQKFIFSLFIKPKKCSSKKTFNYLHVASAISCRATLKFP